MVRLPVYERLDLVHASRLVRSLAAHMGFGAHEQAELGIVVMELGSNMLKYAGSGSLQLGSVLHETRGRGLEILARDGGPPIRDLGLALKDGCDDTGPIPPERLYGRAGIGAGLGAVVRLTDCFEHTPLEVGKQIRVVRYVHVRAPAAPPRVRRATPRG